MRNSFVKIFIIVLALSLFVQFHAKAQDVASITGLVTDATGAVIPGVSVTLENALTSASYKGVTNAVGSYTIVNVTPGPGYKITFSRDGFNPAAITDLYLNVNSTRTQNVKLQVGTTSATVEVSASAETITLNTVDATVGNSFEVQHLNDLPIANRASPSSLFSLQPGVTSDGAVTGARVDQNNVTLDGLDVNDMATGNFGAIVGSAPVDSVQEFRGVTAGQLSSAGEGGGGQFELVTRSGTAQFHGALVEYHRDTSTEANDWFNNLNGVARPPLIRNQFGGNIGGPIIRQKAFFFFDWNERRDTLSNLVERRVPMDSLRTGSVSYCNNTSTATHCVISTLTPADVKTKDPAGIGFDPAILSVLTNRYPAPNDFSGAAGDLINTAGFRFNAPYPYLENDYVGKVDYNLTANMKVFGRLTFARTTGTQSANQFPGDPQTSPFLDKSHAWVVGHTWTIGSTKTNQASFGQTVTDYNFPNTFNPTGITQYNTAFGGDGSGGTILSGPYASAVNAQHRIYPIPVIRDDFSWLKGKHSFQFGGTFKYVNPAGNTILDYDQPLIGLGGNMGNLNTPDGVPSMRPADIRPTSGRIASYDRAFAFGMGRFAAVTSTYNYDAKGQILPQGTGSREEDRYYESEVYFGDTWKVSPSLTLSYGVRWQNYSVPYSKIGIESVPTLDFDQLFNARVAQSAAGQSGDLAVPFVSYVLGGKANNGPGYFNPGYANFAPRLAFAYSPGYDRKSVFTGGAGIVFDHTVVNAVQYQASQFSYLFQATKNLPNGTTGDSTKSLKNDPRFSGFANPPATPTADPAIPSGYMPFVTGTGTSAVPTGLSNGQAFNEGVDRNLKTPYSIMYNFGFQHEFPQGFILKTNYVGRLGRRLLGQADANQLIDFPDKVSGQMMSTAMINVEKQVRAGENITPQPWFENIIAPGTGEAFGVANNTELVAFVLDPLPFRGDFADTIQALASLNNIFGTEVFPANVGMGSQFSEDTYYTNKGFSSYNGMLATLHKNAGHGLQFDLNYTWSHSIDNVSIHANQGAIGGYGFICDVLRPRNCRGNSDFDVTQYFNGTFIYDLPIGRGRTYAATAPLWLNEAIGGWSLSGIPSWHTGNAYFATGNAFVAGYANNAPVILTGDISQFAADVHKGADGSIYGFKAEEAGLNAFTGPVGFQIGTRNNLRGPGFLNVNLGVAKSFPIYKERVSLKFRVDAFNAFNHPSFAYPGQTISGEVTGGSDITETSSTFGTVGATVSTARVLQGALRLEF